MDVPQSSLGAPLQTWGKSRRTFVDATLALNEGGKRFRTRLVLRCIPQHARPFRAFVHFCEIGCATDNHGKWLIVIGWPDIPYPQRPTCPADGPTFCRPPHYELEHATEVCTDRITSPTGLAVPPSRSNPGEILPQRFLRIGYWVLNGPVQPGRKAGRQGHYLDVVTAQDTHATIRSGLSNAAPYV
jgi:hypothetical protein